MVRTLDQICVARMHFGTIIGKFVCPIITIDVITINVRNLGLIRGAAVLSSSDDVVVFPSSVNKLSFNVPVPVPVFSPLPLAPCRELEGDATLEDVDEVRRDGQYSPNSMPQGTIVK